MNGFYSGIKATGVDQKVFLSGINYRETFWVTDLSVGYRLPKRYGSVSVIVKNVFDEQFQYQDRNFQTTEPVAPLYEPEQTIYVQFTLAI